MNDIIKAIEDAQLKSEVADFRVGDTVKVYAKVIEGSYCTLEYLSVSRYSRVQYLRDRMVERERHLQLESSLMV